MQMLSKTHVSSYRQRTAIRNTTCVLQCVAVCCSVLQCAAMCCSVLQCVAVCCSVLQCVAVLPLPFTHTVQHTAIRNTTGVLKCAAVCCSVLQCVAARCNVPSHPHVPSNRQHTANRKYDMCVVACCSVLQCVAVFPASLTHTELQAAQGE